MPYMRQCEIYGRARQRTDGGIIRTEMMHFACWIPKARIHTRSHNLSRLLRLHGNNGYTNEPRCC